MKVRKAVIPAGGLGTRFLPATKAQPKEMLPIVDKPTIQYIVEEAVASGIEEILIITGRNKRAIEDHFDRSIELELELRQKQEEALLKQVLGISDMVDIYYIRQKEAKGLGHAIKCAETFVGKEPFAVLLGDEIIQGEVPGLKQLIDLYNQYRTSILGVQKVAPKEVERYGIIDYHETHENIYHVKGVVEKPKQEAAPSQMAILGRYIITPEIFDILSHVAPGVGGEIQLTDGLKTLLREQSMWAYNIQGKRYDIGSRQGFLQATVEIALKREDLKDDFKAYLKNMVNSELL